MTHNARIRLDPNWIVGPPLTAAELNTLDATIVKGINGDGGSSHTPTANIILNGAGLRLAGGAHLLSGASSVVLEIGGLAAFVTYGDNDYRVLPSGHPGRSRSIIQNAGDGIAVIGWRAIGGLESRLLGGRSWLPFTVHDGAQIASVTVGFVVATVHSNVPDVLPTFRPIAVDAQGNVWNLATSAVGGAVSFAPTPASGSAWTASGAEQTFTVTCDALVNNPRVLVDRSAYSYFVEVVDESGNNALIGNQYQHVSASFTNIDDCRPF